MSLFCFISKHLNMISRHSLILPTLLLANSLHADETITEQMRTLAEQFIYNQMVIDPTSQVEVTAATIDTRHAMHPCDKNLTASVAGNGDIKRNTTVRLVCEAEPRWEVYVPVRVTILRPFVTVADAITKPEVTPLLGHAQAIGCATMPGLGMLDAQADIIADFLLGRERPA